MYQSVKNEPSNGSNLETTPFDRDSDQKGYAYRPKGVHIQTKNEISTPRNKYPTRQNLIATKS